MQPNNVLYLLSIGVRILSKKFGVIMADHIIGQYSISIRAGMHWNLKLPVSDIEGFYLFQVNVEQKDQALRDVGIYIMDEDNFKSWDFALQAIRAGASAEKLPSFVTFTHAKLPWGTISFVPPSPGQYRIVVDNTYSKIKSKNVTVDIYWMSHEWGARRSVREATRRFNWTEAWRLFELSEEDLKNGKFSSSCDTMRKALVLLWINVCETLSRKPVSLDPSKSPDIGMLKERIGPYAPDYAIGQLSHVWSLASELAHIEKRGGREPPLNEVIYAFRLALSSAAFLVSLYVPPS